MAAASSGSLLFGGVDTEKYSGSLINLPISGLSDPSLHDLEVQFTSLTISDSSGTSSLTPPDMVFSACLDSGTTQMLLPNSIVEQIIQYTGTVEGFLPCNLNTCDTILTFGFGAKDGARISVPMSELIMSYVGDTFFADGTEACELGVSGQPAGEEVILGDTFLRSAYVAYNLDAKRIGFAHTKWYAGSASNNVEIDKENPMPGAKDELALLPVPNPSSASSTEPAPNQAAGASETALASASASATQADGTLPFMPMEASCTARSSALPEPAVYVSAAAITSGSTSATATATRAVSTASTNVVAPSKSFVPFLGAAGPRLSLSVGMISGFGVVVLGMILFE